MYRQTPPIKLDVQVASGHRGIRLGRGDVLGGPALTWHPACLWLLMHSMEEQSMHNWCVPACSL